MKIFIDSTSIESIKECISKSFVDGITTNPNLMKSINKSKIEFVKEIASNFPNLPISIQIKEQNVEEMIK